jgi:predicted nucleic acid-binding protein
VTNEADRDLVVDTGPLSHLAEAGWLSVLRSVAGGRAVLIPDAVEAELRQGIHLKPHLQQVLDAEWITTRSIASDAELASFAQFAARLVVGTRNVGEAAVLAYAQVHGAIAVIDDGAGRKAARDFSVALRPTLALLCHAIRDGVLTVRMVSDLADHLLETEYRLPFGPGGFEIWADEHGLVPRAE